MEKNNKGLMILIAILSVIILGLVGYITYDKISENDEKENIVDNNKEENNEVDNNEISSDLQAYYSKFSGKYGIGKTEVDEDFCNSDRVGKTETGYIFFEIKNDGTAIYRTGDYCAGGMSVSGKYIIDYDKIYIIDDICNFECYEGNCHIPNCTRVISVNYKEKNGKIVIYEEHNGQITELERR